MIANYLDLNADLAIQGLLPKDVVAGEARSLEEYVTNVVLPMGELAKSLVLLVTPIVLRIQLAVRVFDTNDSSETAVSRNPNLHRSTRKLKCINLRSQALIMLKMMD